MWEVDHYKRPVRVPLPKWTAVAKRGVEQHDTRTGIPINAESINFILMPSNDRNS